MAADPNRRSARTFALVFLGFTLGGAVSGAAAQTQPVRKCQLDGRVVFQSSPCAARAQEAVPVTRAAAPATAPAVAEAAGLPKKKSLADLLRERDGNDRVRTSVHEPQGDGATLLRSRMGAV